MDRQEQLRLATSLLFASLPFFVLFFQGGPITSDLFSKLAPFLLAVFLSEWFDIAKPNEKTTLRTWLLTHKFELILWLTTFVFSTPITRLYLLLILSAQLLGNSSPLRDLQRFCQVYIHYSTLGIVFDFPSIIRCVFTGTVQDLETVDKDKERGRLTIAMYPRYRILFIITCILFVLCTPVPSYSILAYLFIAGNITSPQLCSVVWTLNYAVELFFRSQIHYDYRYDELKLL